MAYLATLPPDTSVPSGELSGAAHIPPHYLSKLMRQLVVASLVVSKRGQGGGFMLAKVPEQIHFIEILEALGFPGDTENCLFGWERCNPDTPCPLHPAWSELKKSFLTWAQDTTLGDVRDGWSQVTAHLPVV